MNDEQEAKAKQFIKSKFGSISGFCKDAGIAKQTLYNSRNFTRYLSLAKTTKPSIKRIKNTFWNRLKELCISTGKPLKQVAEVAGIDYFIFYKKLSSKKIEDDQLSYFIMVVMSNYPINLNEIYQDYEQHTEIEEINSSSQTESGDTTETPSTDRKKD